MKNLIILITSFFMVQLTFSQNCKVEKDSIIGNLYISGLSSGQQFIKIISKDSLLYVSINGLNNQIEEYTVSLIKFNQRKIKFMLPFNDVATVLKYDCRSKIFCDKKLSLVCFEDFGGTIRYENRVWTPR
jgi:hypothetical protein